MAKNGVSLCGEKVIRKVQKVNERTQKLRKNRFAIWPKQGFRISLISEIIPDAEAKFVRRPVVKFELVVIAVQVLRTHAEQLITHPPPLPANLATEVTTVVEFLKQMQINRSERCSTKAVGRVYWRVF